ncbi:hypothetical protein D9M72_435740 [compost metagenome]
MLLRQLRYLGAATRQDGDQVASLEDQQRFAYRPAADIHGLGDFLFLDALTLFQLAANDALGKVLGNLLGEAVRCLERHGYPSIWGTLCAAPEHSRGKAPALTVLRVRAVGARAKRGNFRLCRRTRTGGGVYHKAKNTNGSPGAPGLSFPTLMDRWHELRSPPLRQSGRGG